MWCALVIGLFGLIANFVFQRKGYSGWGTRAEIAIIRVPTIALLGTLIGFYEADVLNPTECLQ